MIFKNKNNKIRAGWRIAMVLVFFILLFIASTVIISIAFGIAAAADVHQRNGGFTDNLWSQMGKLMENPYYGYLLNIAQTLCMVLAVIIVLKIVDHRRMSDIGVNSISSGFKDLAYGMFLGAASMIAVFAVLLISGSISLINEFSTPNISVSIITGFLMFIFVGFNEELFARAYCISVLQSNGSRWIPAIISSVIFSLMHGMNPNLSVLGLINIFLVGLLFAYMFLKTNSLWLPVGYHITWNFFQGNVFGFSVSGMPLDSIYSVKLNGNSILNGGAFGPEGGLMATLVVVLGFVFVSMYTRKSFVGLPLGNRVK
ncbi:MAG: CPBP family intramembrane metalloprotease [Clostridia bacterium]|nr:CPBP family intramembrane metalloprotease [Clostridia bacterium]